MKKLVFVLSFMLMLLCVIKFLSRDRIGSVILPGSDGIIPSASSSETAKKDDPAKSIPPDTGQTDIPVILPSDTDSGDTSEALTDEPADTVYWVRSGEVWHTRENCPSLSRSKEILSGSVDAALSEGKTRACKRCAA